MTCDRCGADAELGRCSFCHRDLCLSCFDADQDGYCHPLGRRNEAIRALRGDGISRDEVAERFGLTIRTVSRVTNG